MRGGAEEVVEGVGAGAAEGEGGGEADVEEGEFLDFWVGVKEEGGGEGGEGEEGGTEAGEEAKDEEGGAEGEEENEGEGRREWVGEADASELAGEGPWGLMPDVGPCGDGVGEAEPREEGAPSGEAEEEEAEVAGDGGGGGRGGRAGVVYVEHGRRPEGSGSGGECNEGFRVGEVFLG